MTIAQTAATSFPANRPEFGDIYQSDAERWKILSVAHSLGKTSRSPSNTLGSSHQFWADRFGAPNNTQTDLDEPLVSHYWSAYRTCRFLAPSPHASYDLSERLIYSTVDPRERYRADLVQRLMGVAESRIAYQRRIEELSKYGVEDGITLSEASHRDFWAFIDSANYLRRAEVVLMDNGDLRAVWRGDDQSHLALHFLGGRSVRYVVFKRRPASKHVSRVAGTDTFNGIKWQVLAFNLMSLVNG